MNLSDTIIDIVKSSSSGHRKPFWLFPCKVDAVYEDKRAIDCSPLGFGPAYKDVILQGYGNFNAGCVFFPAVGSVVLVAHISNVQLIAVSLTEITKAILTIGNTEVTVEDNAVSLVTEKVRADIAADKLKLDIDGTTLEMDGDKSVWNGGSETTANATNLKQELTKMSARIDAIINAIKSGVPSPMDGGAAYKASMIPIVSAPPKEDFSKMIDDKIKH